MWRIRRQLSRTLRGTDGKKIRKHPRVSGIGFHIPCTFLRDRVLCAFRHLRRDLRGAALSDRHRLPAPDLHMHRPEYKMPGKPDGTRLRQRVPAGLPDKLHPGRRPGPGALFPAHRRGLLPYILRRDLRGGRDAHDRSALPVQKTSAQILFRGKIRPPLPDPDHS